MRYVVSTHSGNLNVRGGPGTAFRVVGKLRRGTAVEAADDRNGWCRLLPNGGWVSARYLRPAGTAPAAPPTSAVGLNWINLWHNYPNGGPEAVKRAIGGAVDADWITNTCTIRLSRALNYGGAPVPRNFPGLHTVRGADGLNYAFRVREMRSYLQYRLGQPTIRAATDRQQAVTGHRGIIAFDVRIWSDATGHMDLWDGNNIRHHAYFREASEVFLWEVR